MGCSRLHDIGKARMPVSILEKPCEFDQAETIAKRKHSESGLAALASAIEDVRCPAISRRTTSKRGPDERHDIRDDVRSRPLFSPVICPSGCFAIPLSSPLYKNISVFQKPESVVVLAPSRLGKRGVRTIVTKREAGCGGRGCDARRATRSRTAKSCGPGAPTLALSFRWKQFRGSDGGKRARSPGRARSNR
jgi:hypothetical protein